MTLNIEPGAIEPDLIWLVAGLALAALEVLAPGFFLIWLGLAAIGTGAASMVLPLGFLGETVLFALLAAALCTAGWRAGRRRTPSRVNTAWSGLVGRVATVLPADGPQARVRLGDSDWAARPDGPEPMPPQGSAVEVTAVCGTILLVRPRQSGSA